VIDPTGMQHAMVMNALLPAADAFVAARRSYFRSGGDVVTWRLTFGTRHRRNAVVRAQVLVRRAPPAFRQRRTEPPIPADPLGEAVRALEHFIAVSREWRPRLFPKPPAPLWCDASGAVLGVRGWRITDGPKQGTRLRSLVGAAVQWPRGVMVAECRLRPSVCDRPAGSNCVCGIYAYKTTVDALRLLAERAQAVGLVRGWGRVAIHELGWRAEFVQPLWLCVVGRPQEQARALGVRYECDAVPVDTVEEALDATATQEEEMDRWPG
jgi:hypothetical protein